MMRLICVIISIGLLDSVNPTTVAPALYLATGKRGRRAVVEFTLAVFTVYLLGGIAIALGPGRLLLAALPHPSHQLEHILEIAVGAAMSAAAVLLWWRRHRLARRRLLTAKAHTCGGAVLGATITAAELPTAFPYFGAIAVIVGSGMDRPHQIALLTLFSACFVVPLLGIVALVTFVGDEALRPLTRARVKLHAHWPTCLAGLGLTAGLGVAAVGLAGLA
jgi:cytochrome c biogenesis protein CcdA